MVVQKKRLDLNSMHKSAITLLVFVLLAVPVSAQITLVQYEAAVASRTANLELFKDKVSDTSSDLAAVQDDIRSLRRSAFQDGVPFKQKLEELKSDLERLGPVPAEGEAIEAPEIAEERTRLTTEIARLNGAVVQAELNMAEADRLLAQISEVRLEQFSNQIIERVRSPLSPVVWKEAYQHLVDHTQVGSENMADWNGQLAQQNKTWIEYGLIVLVFVSALIIFFPIKSRLGALASRVAEGLEPKKSRKILVAAAQTLAVVLPGIVSGFFVYQSFDLLGVITSETTSVAQAVFLTFVMVQCADGATVGLLAPKNARWRLANLDSTDVSRLRILIFIAVLTLGSEFVIRASAPVFDPSLALISITQSLITLILALSLILICARSIWTQLLEPAQDEKGEDKRGGLKIWLAGNSLAILSLVSVAAGYVPLGHYLMTRTFYLIGLAAIIWLLRSMLRESVRLFDARFTSSKNTDEQGEKLVYFWIGMLIDTIAVLAFIPPALLILGAEWIDVRDGIREAFFGFTIGSVRISLAEIMFAIALFFVLLQATRFIQKTAETRLFPRSRIDVGVQNSLRTLIGYVGLVIAFAAAVGTLGFDLSNLAIIAGALSVGIGFGLQSIVNNFVSGLILLFERPIKVGDWIVTASGEGIVKRISVRSTEIETFDRSSVIVPNSELIASSVTNWTHKRQNWTCYYPGGSLI